MLLLIIALSALSIALLWALTIIRRLQRQLHTLFTDPAYGILTRAGGEARWHTLRGPRDIIFVDLDDMHAANASMGYAEVDRRIAAAFAMRRTDVLLAMRWYSGDELVAVVPAGTGVTIAERLLDALRMQALSGTFGVVPVVDGQLLPAVQTAAALVQQAKVANRRGQVMVITPSCRDGDALALGSFFPCTAEVVS